MSFTQEMLRTLLASCCTYERGGCMALYFYSLPYCYDNIVIFIICCSFLTLGKESSELQKENSLLLRTLLNSEKELYEC